MRIDLNLSQKVLILVTLPIIFMLVFVSVLAQQQKRAEDAVWKERHAKNVINECNSLLYSMLLAGYCLHVQRQNSDMDEFDKIFAKIPEQVRTIKLLVKDNPEQLALINEFEAMSVTTMVDMNKLNRVAGHGADVEILGMGANDLIKAVGRATSLLKEIVFQQQQQLSPESSKSEEKARMMVSQMLMGGVAGSILLALILAVLFNRSTTKRLLVLVDNTDKLKNHKELNPLLEGKDEVAKLDQVFHEMAKSLDEAAQYKQEMMSVVSHDLRAPLTSIQGALTLLTTGIFGDLPDKALKNIRVAEKNCRQLVNLINDLLDFEKMESGRLEFTMQPFVVQELLDQVESMVSIAAEQKGIKLAVVETELILNGDIARLSQVLINLISNAVKFSPPNSTITLSAQQIDSIAELRVSDQGRGIPAEFLDSIFDRYKQVSKDDGARGHGTGLGLAICKAFVEGHNGTIGVDSEVGKGSSFWIRIPISN